MNTQLCNWNIHKNYHNIIIVIMFIRHSITSDRWTQLYLTGDNTTRFTIHDALTSWLAVNGSVEYSDTCQGILI